MSTKLLEKLAELEHEQWVTWSQTIAAKENLSKERVERWRKYWVPYAELDEETKEYDRKWARKVIDVVKEFPTFTLSSGYHDVEEFYKE